MRINARLDETSVQQLDYIHGVTHENVTDIVKYSVNLYYQEVKQKCHHRTNLLLNSGFVGCGSATKDLSSKYKKLLTKDWS